MKPYDPGKPLIFSHIPKTAGTSVRELFADWYGPNLLLHYKRKNKPPVHDLKNPPEPGRPVAVFGPFNAERGVGINSYYPHVEQFVTILRDPLERAISAYFFKTQNETMRRAFWGTAKITLDQYIMLWPGFLTYKPGTVMKYYFPGVCTEENFQNIFESQFIEIGITERLELSLNRIADKLGFEFDATQLQHLNAVSRTQEVSEKAKAKFMARNALEYKIYNFAKERLN